MVPPRDERGNPNAHCQKDAKMILICMYILKLQVNKQVSRYVKNKEYFLATQIMNPGREKISKNISRCSLICAFLTLFLLRTMIKFT